MINNDVISYMNKSSGNSYYYSLYCCKLNKGDIITVTTNKTTRTSDYYSEPFSCNDNQIIMYTSESSPGYASLYRSLAVFNYAFDIINGSVTRTLVDQFEILEEI